MKVRMDWRPELSGFGFTVAVIPEPERSPSHEFGQTANNPRRFLRCEINAFVGQAQVTPLKDFPFGQVMRPEEAIALRWSDIDWNRMTVRIQQVRAIKGSERDGSKTHSEREVNLLPQAVDALLTMKPYTFMLKIERVGDSDSAADIFQNPVTGRAWHDERSQRDTFWRPSLKRLEIR